MLSLSAAEKSCATCRAITCLQFANIASAFTEIITPRTRRGIDSSNWRENLVVRERLPLDDTATNETTVLHSKATGKFTNTLSGGEESLFMKGNFFDSQATITSQNFGEMPVAMIRRDRWNARELLGGQQTYGVEVAPGMDMAIIVAMVIMLDERENEQKG